MGWIRLYFGCPYNYVGGSKRLLSKNCKLTPQSVELDQCSMMDFHRGYERMDTRCNVPCSKIKELMHQEEDGRELEGLIAHGVSGDGGKRKSDQFVELYDKHSLTF